MRIRATVAAVSGALVLSAFAVPAAQAADASSASASAAGPAVTYSAITVNKGKAIVVGTTAKVVVPTTFTATHAADLDVSEDNFATGLLIYQGATIAKATNILGGDDPATCTATSSTVLSCTGSIDIRPKSDDLVNSEAGTWNVGGVAVDSDDNVKYKSGLGTTTVKRAAQLTANATPEPVKKGKTITVTGTLNRANWETHKFGGYVGSSVKLQFKAAGSSTYTTLKTIKSGTKGALKTTTKATVDGTYRFSYAGNASTGAVNSTGDAVDVQ
ncbi:hypothetical protein OK074_3476 [Actinobacteria bacterium OK074]|nr:hypothetical protein OK074_3476 [Actinobacteria bacterium OK074]